LLRKDFDCSVVAIDSPLSSELALSQRSSTPYNVTSGQQSQRIWAFAENCENTRTSVVMERKLDVSVA
jgi:hypothetical protein